MESVCVRSTLVASRTQLTTRSTIQTFNIHIVGRNMAHDAYARYLLCNEKPIQNSVS